MTLDDSGVQSQKCRQEMLPTSDIISKQWWAWASFSRKRVTPTISGISDALPSIAGKVGSPARSSADGAGAAVD